jgi:hypothetical protein
MIDGFVLLTPLLILPVFLLIRFIGCPAFGSTPSSGGGTPTPAPPSPPSYESQVMADPSLVAYWRLGEPAPPAPPAPDPAKAKDEKIPGNDGDYVTAPANQPATDVSEGGLSGKAERGTASSSLLETEKSRTSVDFEGGFVRVPNFGTVMLSRPSFTLEAWVRPKAWQSGSASSQFAHTVVTMAEVDGAASLPVPPRGFALYAQWVNGTAPDDPLPAGTPAGFYWRVSIGTGTGTEFSKVTVWDKQVVPNRRTYLVVTHDNAKTADQLTVHVGMGGPPADAGGWMATLTTSFAPAQASRLYIGASNLKVSPAEDIYAPFIGNIQEVAIYSYVVPYETLLTRALTNLEPAS